MNPGRTVHATWLAMLTAQTIGAIDGKHKLPAPKRYVAITVVWGILFLLADTGLGRIAARLSVLILLTASIIGPFGQRVVQFLNSVATNFAVQPPAQSGAGATVTPGVAPAPSAQSQMGTA